ncbi:MAG: LacI family transcriptional regulator, partial [Nocardioidaceae bacterium]|nr:LacI family transcriptional regulator [Nocardioidaceae bacterium]
ARAAGVSTATASYALRGQRGSAATVERVLAAAAELGYQANPIAAALASGRTRTVGIICGSLRDVWQQALAADLSRALAVTGRHALVADADGDPARESELLSQLRAQRPEGLLVAPLDPFAAHWESAAAELPVVAIGDRLAAAPSAGAVVFDNSTGFALVFEHLHRLGHRRIAVVLPQRPHTPDRPAESLVAEQGDRLTMHTQLWRLPPASDRADPAAALLREALSGADRPSAVFCLSDALALRVLRVARELALDVPGDLSVVGFDNVAFADLIGPGLTTVDWGNPAMIEAAVNQLVAAGQDPDSLHVRVIGPRLIIGGTSGPAA